MPSLRTRLTRLSEIETILRRVRGRNSYWFLLRQALLRPPVVEQLDFLPKATWRDLGLRPAAVRGLAGIHAGLSDEVGGLQATATCLEIIAMLGAHKLEESF